MIRDTSAQDRVLDTIPVWRRKKTYVAATVVLMTGLVALTTFASWRNSTQSISADRLTIATVTRGTLVRDATVNGRMVAANSPTLYASAGGTVTLKVNAGDKIRKGDVVAEIDSPDLMNEFKREQAVLDELESEIARQKILARKQKLLAQRDADTAEIERVSAERAYQRIEHAGVLGVVQKNEFLRAQDALKSAEIRARHAAQASGLEGEDVDLALKSKLAQLQQQKLQRDNLQRRVDELRLRAPVDGVVGTLSVANRTVVAANTALMTLVDLSQLEVELEIPETYVADLGIGMHVELNINGIKAMGTLSALSPEVVKNQVLARARFSGEVPAGLRQSQRVNARLLIEEKPGVLMVQRGPFIESEGGHFAYVVENGIAHRRTVRIGATSVTSAEVLEGIKEGEKVVVAGTELFEKASSVSINP